MIILDANNIGFRALHKLSNLSYEEKPTGVIFGFLRTMLNLAEVLGEPNLVFCWDSKDFNVRRYFFEDYKNSRRAENLDEEQNYLRRIGYYQFEQLQNEILPGLGFNNIFMQEGIEADDLIAKIVIDYPDEEKVVVSSDTDLYQLLPRLKGIYNLNKKILYTVKDFIEEWGISPSKWTEAKAIAGDKSDNIPGVKGVGLISACKYLNFLAGESLRKKINSEDALIKRNLRLISLPHRRTRSVIITKSFEFDLGYFEYICRQFYLLSFLNKDQYNKWKRVFNGTQEKR